MVIKGGARSGPGELALHLLRTDHNELVHVRELRGVTAAELSAALREMDAMGLASRSGRRLYHANIDWRQDEHMTDAQKARAVERLAAELGLSDQPRAVVEHVKHGREHLHVVWLRIDPETGKAISDSHNYRRHEIVSRDLEREFGHERVQGAHIERDGRDRPDRTPELHEMRQTERSGMTPAEAKAELTRLWRSTDTGCAFMAAIEDTGWHLVKGDKRDLVALDQTGEAHSLARRIEGAKAKEIRERLADIDPANLPSVEQARQAIRDRQRETLTQLELEPKRNLAPAAPVQEIGPQQQAERDQVAAILRSLDDQARDIAALISTRQPDHEAQAQVRKVEGVEIAVQARQAIQPPSHEVEREGQPVELRLERSRLVNFVLAGRDKLAALAGRLEQAFQAVLRHQPKRDPKRDPSRIQQHEKPARDPEREKPAAAERDPWDEMIERGRKAREAQPPEPKREPERDTGRSLWEDWSQGRERKPKGPGW